MLQTKSIQYSSLILFQTMAIPTLFCHDDDDDNGPPRPNKTSNFCPDVVIVVVVSWVCSLRYFHNSTGDTRQKGLQDTIHTTTRACKSRPLFRGNPVTRGRPACQPTDRIQGLVGTPRRLLLSLDPHRSSPTPSWNPSPEKQPRQTTGSDLLLPTAMMYRAFRVSSPWCRFVVHPSAALSFDTHLGTIQAARRLGDI